jgi:hypothetical protein
MIRMVAATEQFPSSLFISGVDLGDDLRRGPDRVGGLADIYKGTYRGTSVALKRLRTYTNDGPKLFTVRLIQSHCLTVH